MASDYLTSIPAGIFRVVDHDPPHRVWGENLTYVQALALKERIVGAEKSRSAKVVPMTSPSPAPAAPPPAPPTAPIDLPPITHVARNMRPAEPIRDRYPLRFLREVGVRATLRIYWGKTIWHDNRQVWGPCPNSYGLGRMGIHNATKLIGETLDGYDSDFGGELADYADDAWPTQCDHCDAIVPPRELESCNCGKPGCMRETEGSPRRCLMRNTLYQATTGDTRVRAELEPGDMFWATWYSCTERRVCIHGWTNCDGKHLVICCPNGDGSVHHWDVMGRASNCTLPEDTLHRCWVLQGDPERGLVSVNKTGRTCGAGGGSIQTGRYHGVAENGILRQC